MSFSAGASGPLSEVADKLRQAFDNNYPEPAEGVEEMFTVGEDAVRNFAVASNDQDNYSVSVSGHSQQADPDSARDALSISIQPTS